jgi:inositol oxygenase
MRDLTPIPQDQHNPDDQIKLKEDFRNYVNSSRQDTVRRHYEDMRTNQTLAFVQKMHKKYSFTDTYREKMTIREAFKKLESYVDSSDPDLSLPNLVHMLQTAEGIRRDGHPDWMQLVGLIHDMGKIMFLVRVYSCLLYFEGILNSLQ